MKSSLVADPLLFQLLDNLILVDLLLGLLPLELVYVLVDEVVQLIVELLYGVADPLVLPGQFVH